MGFVYSAQKSQYPDREKIDSFLIQIKPKGFRVGKAKSRFQIQDTTTRV